MIQLTSDTLSIEYQRAGGVGGGNGDLAGSGDGKLGLSKSVDIGGESLSEGEQVVRCDISVKGFHLKVSQDRLWKCHIYRAADALLTTPFLHQP